MIDAIGIILIGFGIMMLGVGLALKYYQNQNKTIEKIEELGENELGKIVKDPNYESKIVVTNLAHIVNRKTVEDLGIITGSIAPSRFIVRDIMAGLRNMLGREMKEYTEMMETGREVALKRLTDKARELHADAVVNVRFAGSSASQGSSEIMAYGTAVKLDDN